MILAYFLSTLFQHTCECFLPDWAPINVQYILQCIKQNKLTLTTHEYKDKGRNLTNYVIIPWHAAKCLSNSIADELLQINK